MSRKQKPYAIPPGLHLNLRNGVLPDVMFYLVDTSIIRSLKKFMLAEFARNSTLIFTGISMLLVHLDHHFSFQASRHSMKLNPLALQTAVEPTILIFIAIRSIYGDPLSTHVQVKACYKTRYRLASNLLYCTSDIACKIPTGKFTSSVVT